MAFSGEAQMRHGGMEQQLGTPPPKVERDPQQQQLPLDKPREWLTLGAEASFDMLEAKRDTELREDIEDQMYAEGVPDELMEALRMIEVSEVRRGHPDAKPLPSDVRVTAIRFLSTLMPQVQLSLSNWFECVTLFDYVCANLKGGLPVERVPVTCVAIIRIVKKMEESKGCYSGEVWAGATTIVSQWLNAMGYDTATATERSLNDQEKTVLSALNYQTKLPTLELWLSKLCSRFNVLSQRMFPKSLGWIWERSMCHGQMALGWKSITEGAERGSTPRLFAVGLICLGLVGAQLLPLQALRPEKLEPCEWEHLFCKSQLLQAVPVCTIPERFHSIMGALQEAAMADTYELKDAAWRAAEALASMTSSICPTQPINEAH